MAQMNLSSELINELHAVIVKHDAEAKDYNVAVQYLAAVMGLILGHQNMPNEQRLSFLDDLCGFSRHVLNDVVGQQEPEPEPPQQEAFGIWKPE